MIFLVPLAAALQAAAPPVEALLVAERRAAVVPPAEVAHVLGRIVRHVNRARNVRLELVSPTALPAHVSNFVATKTMQLAAGVTANASSTETAALTKIASVLNKHEETATTRVVSGLGRL